MGAQYAAYSWDASLLRGGLTGIWRRYWTGSRRGRGGGGTGTGAVRFADPAATAYVAPRARARPSRLAIRTRFVEESHGAPLTRALDA
jgi:hypothetical protein